MRLKEDVNEEKGDGYVIVGTGFSPIARKFPGINHGNVVQSRRELDLTKKFEARNETLGRFDLAGTSGDKIHKCVLQSCYVFAADMANGS